MHEKHDQEKTFDHFGRDRATVRGSCDVYFAGCEIETIMIDRDGRHTGKVASSMRTVHQQEVEDAYYSTGLRLYSSIDS